LTRQVRQPYEKWVQQWELIPEGEPFRSGTGQTLLPVRYRNQPAMLKISTAPEEQNGAHVMVWWDGIGAASIFAHDGDALLLERATGERDLVAMSRAGQDDEAIRILVAVAQALHAPRPTPAPPTLMPMAIRFRALLEHASLPGDFYDCAATTVRKLLANPLDRTILHGDIQHYNILDFGDRGWLMIDPKGVLGESTFDFANIFCNPLDEIALSPGRVAHRADLIAELTGIDRTRLLQWVVAYCGLSACWHLEDGTDPTCPLTVGKAALAELART